MEPVIKRSAADTNNRRAPVVAIFFVLFLLAGAVIWTALDSVKKAEQDHLTQLLSLLLTGTQHSLHQYIHDLQDDLEMIARHQDFQILVRELQKAYDGGKDEVNHQAQAGLRDYFQPLLKKHEAHGFFVFTRNGISIASSYDHTIGIKTGVESQYDHFQRVLEGEARLVLPFPSQVALPAMDGEFRTGEPTMFLLVPVFNSERHITNVLGLRLDPSKRLSETARLIRWGETGDVFYFNKKGELISEARFDNELRERGFLAANRRSILNVRLSDPGINLWKSKRSQFPENRPLTLMARDAVAGKSGVNVAGYRGYRGVAVIGAWTWEKRYNIGVAYEIDYAEAFAEYRFLQRTILAALTVLVLLFVALFYIRDRELSVSFKNAQKVADKENTIRTLSNAVRDAIVMIDSTGRVQFWNDGAQEMFQYSQEEIMSRRFHSLVAPEVQRPAAVKGLAEFARTGTGPVLGSLQHLTALRKDGSMFDAELSISAFQMRDKWWAAGTVRDITARVEMENQLKEAQRIALIGSWRYQFNTRHLTLSAEAFNIINLDPALEQIPVQQFIALIHPEDRKSVKQAFQDAMDQRQPFAIDHRVLLEDGTQKQLHIRCEIQYGPDGSPEISMGTFQDVTVAREKEKELARLWERFNLAARAAKVGIWDWEVQGDRLTWNSIMYDLYGIRKDEFTGRAKDWVACVAPEDIQSTNDELESALAGEKPFNVRFRIIRPDNTTRYIKADAQVHRDAQGKPVRMVGTNIDITRQVDSERALNRLNDDLATGIEERTKELEKAKTAALSIMQDAEAQRKKTQKALRDLEQSQQQLAESENRFRGLVESTHDIIWEQDSEGRFTYISPTGEKILGYASTEMVGRKRTDFTTPEEHESMENMFQQKIKAKQSIRAFVHSLMHKKGKKKIFLESNIRPVFDAKGEFIGLRGVSRDITDNIKTEDSIRKLARAVEASPVSVVITDLKGCIEYVNPRCCELTGYTAGEMIGQNPSMLKSGMMDDTVYKTLWETIASDNQWRGNLCNRKKDGAFYWERVSISPIKNDLNKITHYVALKEDITEQREIRKSLELAQFSVDHSPDMAFWVRPDGEVTYANQQGCRMLGYTQKTIQGLAFNRITDDERFDYANWGNSLKSVQASSGQIYETRMITSTGRTFPAEISLAYHIFNHQDYLFVTAKNITERKVAEKALHSALKKAESASRAKADFLANMSHEIRTPMNAVIGMTHLMMETQLSQKQQDYMNKINISSKSLLTIINDILDFSKIEAGKLSIEKTEFSMVHILEDTTALFVDKLARKEVELFYDIDENVPTVLIGDPTRITQIFNNLLSNAVKFTEKGDIDILVKTKEIRGDTIILDCSVSDTGIGMSKEQVDGLFQKFEQADTSTTRKYGGTGLGLAISQQLVHLMDGRIDAQSKKGKGTVFHFTLVLNFRPDLREKAGSRKLPHALSNLNVLLLNQKSSLRAKIEKMLHSFKFSVMSTDSISEACRQARQSERAFDLVFVEYDLAQGVLEHPECRQVPVIVLADVNQSSLSESVISEFDNATVMVKPVNPSSLFNTIITVFGITDIPMERRRSKKEKNAPDMTSVVGAQILLAEDNEMNQQVAEELLKKTGVHVTTVGDGKHCVESVQKREFNLVLMDIQMPEMDGLTAAKKIRSLGGAFISLPIVAMTAHAMSEDHAKSLAAGMNDHITKPIDPIELYNCLLHWIDPLTIKSHAPPEDFELFPDEGENSVSRLKKMMPDIDVDLGVHRLSGNIVLYSKLLGDFSDNYSDFMDRIRSSLSKNDADLALQLVHTVKGLSATLGATALNQKIIELENSLKAGADIPEPLLAAVQSLMDSVLRQMKGALPAQDNDPKSVDVSRADIEDMVLPALETLNELLGIGDMSCQEKLESIHPYLISIIPDEAKHFLESVQQFNFNQAKAMLPKIAENVKQYLKTEVP